MTLTMECVWLCNAIIKWNACVRLHLHACTDLHASDGATAQREEHLVHLPEWLCARNCTCTRAYHCSYSPPWVRHGHRKTIHAALRRREAYAKISISTLQSLSCRYMTLRPVLLESKHVFFSQQSGKIDGAEETRRERMPKKRARSYEVVGKPGRERHSDRGCVSGRLHKPAGPASS